MGGSEGLVNRLAPARAALDVLTDEAAHPLHMLQGVLELSRGGFVFVAMANEHIVWSRHSLSPSRRLNWGAYYVLDVKLRCVHVV